MVPYDVTHEQIMDIALILILIAAYIGVYAYGQYKYQRGYEAGLRNKRKIKRAIRRGNVYRLK